MGFLLPLIFVPILTVIAIGFTRSQHQTRMAAAIGMGLQFLLSVNLLIQYLLERKAGNTAEMLFRKSFVWFESLNIKLDIGVDGISVAMILLTGIIVIAGVFASWNMKDLSKEFFISLILLATGVFGFFISIDLFVMFLFYEMAVIPMYLLIGIWGTGPKEYSAMKLTLMLMAGSALILLGILGLYFNSAPDGGALTFNLLEIAKINIPLSAQRMFFPLTFAGFGVLSALFPFHTWSPDGHASAPTAVSMLHAGVLMKLGGYGCLRVAMFLMPQAAHEMAIIFLVPTGISVIYGAFVAVRQKDLKYINAYSSVSHVGLILFALLMLNKTAITGAVLQMVSHGLMTALFFALIGMIYGRTHTRMIDKMGGLLKVMPFLGAAYIIAGFASLGLPGFSGFVAEMNIFVGAFQVSDTFHRVLTILAVSSIVITAVYVLRVVGRLLLGPIEHAEYELLEDGHWYERISTGLLIVAIAGMGLLPLWITDMIRDSLDPIMTKLASTF